MLQCLVPAAAIALLELRSPIFWQWDQQNLGLQVIVNFEFLSVTNLYSSYSECGYE